MNLLSRFGYNTIFFTALLTATVASAQNWTIDKATSKLSIEAVQTEKPFQGEFKEFQARIDFDLQDLAKASLSVNVNTGSFASAASERDETAKCPSSNDLRLFLLLKIGVSGSVWGLI